MARIRTYALDNNVTGSDYWIGTDGNDNSNTKNFSPNSVAQYLNENEVIDVSNSVRFRYDTIDSGQQRKDGTISFQNEIGATVPMSDLSSFVLSKKTQSGKDVSFFLNVLPTTKVILHKSNDINIFGLYKVLSVTTDLVEPNFFNVSLEFISGHGSIEEDKDYIISLIDLNKTIPVLQLTKETFNYASSSSFTLSNTIGNILQVIINTTSLHPEGYSYTLPSTVTILNELHTGDVITVVYNYLEEFLEVPNLQRVTDEGNHTTNNIIIDNIPGEYGSYTVANTLNDVGAFQSYTSPTNIDYQSVYTAYEMSINEIYSPTVNFEMFIGQGIMQTSYTNGSNYNATRLYSGNSTNGPSLYIEKSNITGQLKADNLTANITLQFPNKPVGTYTIATTSDLPAAPGLQEVLAQGNSFTDNQMTAYDPVSDTNTYIRPYGFTFQRDYDLTEYTYNGVHFTTMGSPDVRSNMLNPKRETVGSAIYIFPEKPSGTYTLATTSDVQTIGVVSATESGIVNNTSLQELGGVDKTINGVRVGRGNISSSASENTSVGYQALQSVTHATGNEGWYNTAFGASALKVLTIGYANEAFGAFALSRCTTGTFNTALGGSVMTYLTTGTQNVGIGANALRDNVSGQRNTAVGAGALYRNTGSFNTAIGNLAGGQSTSSGSSNILIGFQAGRDISTGTNNLLIENITNASITSGNFNIILNPKQKSGVTTGSYNTIIGAFDGTFPTGMANNVVLADGQGNVRFRTTETGLTTVPGQTNALIEADTTGKAVVTKQYISEVVKPYKVYTALITPYGINDPFVTVLENTLGGEIAWARVQAGQYNGTLTGVFPIGTYAVANLTHPNFGGFASMYRINSDIMSLRVADATDALVDSLGEVPVEIRIYN